MSNNLISPPHDWFHHQVLEATDTHVMIALQCPVFTVTMQSAASGRYISVWNIQKRKASSRRPMNQHFVICGVVYPVIRDIQIWFNLFPHPSSLSPWLVVNKHYFHYKTQPFTRWSWSPDPWSISSRISSARVRLKLQGTHLRHGHRDFQIARGSKQV